MRTLKLFLLAGCLCLTAAVGAFAQDDAPPAPTPPMPTPGPAPYSLDMPDLRPDNPNATLFPTLPRPVPSPGATPDPNDPNGILAAARARRGHGGGRRGGGGNNQHGRARDQTVELADSDPLDVRVAYRRDKTLAMERDPGLAVLLRQSETASTDVQKRAYLRDYYTRLFAAIQKIDPSPGMKTHVFLLQLVAEQRYDPKRRAVNGEEDLVNGRGGRRRRNN